MKILSIESSCDESSVSIFDTEQGVLLNLIHTQIDLHALYGGVVPDLASSEHLKKLPLLAAKAIKSSEFAGTQKIAVTTGPGLPNCLAIGLSAAKGISAATGLPIEGVNHLRGHAFSPFINIHAKDAKNFEENRRSLLPHLGLVVSGGNTVLFELDENLKLSVIADTVDDAAGEALDKGAKMLGMPYPGAPILEKRAISGKVDKNLFPYGQNRKISEDPNFSFSGLKTSLRYYLEKLDAGEIDERFSDICASYQFAVVEQLRRRCAYFLKVGAYASFGISGGVSNNAMLCSAMENLAKSRGAKFLCAPKEYRGDNAAMIAFAAFFDPNSTDSSQNLKIRPSCQMDLNS